MDNRKHKNQYYFCFGRAEYMILIYYRNQVWGFMFGKRGVVFCLYIVKNSFLLKLCVCYIFPIIGNRVWEQ